MQTGRKREREREREERLVRVHARSSCKARDRRARLVSARRASTRLFEPSKLETHPLPSVERQKSRGHFVRHCPLPPSSVGRGVVAPALVEPRQPNSIQSTRGPIDAFHCLPSPKGLVCFDLDSANFKAKSLPRLFLSRSLDLVRWVRRTISHSNDLFWVGVAFRKGSLKYSRLS